MTILEVKDFSISFTQYTSGLRRKKLKVVTSLNASVKEGEILAVVGSSGSGKSLLAHAILGILPKNTSISGSMYYEGQELTPRLQSELRGREIALIPQSVNFLDPLMKVGEQVRGASGRGDTRELQREVFKRYKLRPEVEDLYPFQLSGGMARRILVATAAISGARLIIADEPTPGLDTNSLEEALEHFRQLAEGGAGVMLITHDIETALKISDRVAVFYAGTTVETSPVKDFCGSGDRLRHPYTKALWRALPQNDFEPIPGFQPMANELTGGCPFEPRCSISTDECRRGLPDEKRLRDGIVRCYHAS